MGYEAALVADAVFVTDDNPAMKTLLSARRFTPERRLGSLSVASRKTVTLANIADRAEAITAAVQWAQPGDAIVVAGKGHETGQLVAGVMHEFDDVEQLRAAVKQTMAQQNQQSDLGDQGGM